MKYYEQMDLAVAVASHRHCVIGRVYTWVDKAFEEGRTRMMKISVVVDDDAEKSESVVAQ